jgi:hypothetical protein
VALAGGCRKEPGAPVARLRIAPASATLGYPALVEVAATWEPIAPLDAVAPPVVFVHLLGAAPGVERTFDHPFPAAWRAGEPTTYPIQLWQSALGPPLVPGSYRLSLGIYDPANDRRWPLVVDGEEIDDQEYVVATVEVPAEPETAPEVTFTGDWHPVGPSGDRQIFASRWLGDEGALEFTHLAGPLAVAMSLDLPDLGDAQHRLVLAEGAPSPELTVASDCTEETLRLSAWGRGDLRLTLVPPAGASSCAVRLAPNFVHLDLKALSRRSVKLDRLTWNEVAAAP